MSTDISFAFLITQFLVKRKKKKKESVFFFLMNLNFSINSWHAFWSIRVCP